MAEIQADSTDRISNLPDNLITHILSFLSTKDAVKTSALSTSWILQWTLVPFICFDEISPYPMFSPSFINFVYRVLLYKMSPLDLFRLKVGRIVDAINVSQWIYVSLSRHVRHIDFCVPMTSSCHLPDRLFLSNTLVVLKLKGYFVFQVPEIISLESLKIFHYDTLKFDGGESFSRLISSCPVLEELHITGQLRENVRVLNISSLVLKRLVLEGLYLDNGGPRVYDLVLNTPNLQYLEHNDEQGVPDAYHLNTLNCLDTARFCFYLHNYAFDQLIPAKPLAELVVAISNVRALYLLRDSFATLKDLYSAALDNFELPKFDRLIYLELGRIEIDEGLRLLIDFLQSSPQLEYLSFNLDCGDETWYPPTDVPFCMLYNLKVIKVESCDALEPLPSMLAYFLEKTNCLKELIILRPEKADEEFIKTVRMLPRASNSCEIVLA